jgi:hypothetical protein
MFLEMVISYTAAVNANNYQNLVLECKTRPPHITPLRPPHITYSLNVGEAPCDLAFNCHVLL